jgi:hypothetical protein
MSRKQHTFVNQTQSLSAAASNQLWPTCRRWSMPGQSGYEKKMIIYR